MNFWSVEGMCCFVDESIDKVFLFKVVPQFEFLVAMPDFTVVSFFL